MATRNCPACNSTPNKSKLFLAENIDYAQLSNSSFASRKLPEFMCHHLVRCLDCSLVYADNPPSQNTLAEAYHTADFDSSEEADDAANAYQKAMESVLLGLPNRDFALEIGTGTGIFLERLLESGFKKVIGVEPSSAAIHSAPMYRREWILESIFKEEDFAPGSIDLICCFMTMEHVRDPNLIISAASRLLREGGAIALVTHDYRAWINRLLGKRSPIIDIEHLQLFSRESIIKILENNGFKSIQVESFCNSYALRYWVRLLPLSAKTKNAIIEILEKLNLADIKIKLNVGNIFSFGYIVRV